MSKKCVYALGFFDGVHLGHGSLLSACRCLADELGVDAGVVTFSSHPETLVRGAAPGLINTLRDRERLLRETITWIPW
jgi:riboflavin kinase/FMN adenylyltransferase